MFFYFERTKRIDQSITEYALTLVQLYRHFTASITWCLGKIGFVNIEQYSLKFVTV